VASPRSQSATPQVPETERGAFSSEPCGNCGAELTGPFCSQCGEKKFTKHDYSVTHLVEEALDGLTHFDTRFLRTLNVLFTRPGELSKAYFQGGRSRYTKPLSLFIIVNVIFFFIQPHTGLLGYKYAHYMSVSRDASLVHKHLRETGEAEATYEARFNENLQHQKKSILIVAVPFLALVMLGLFVRSGRTYAEHLVFSVQVYAFFLVYLAATTLLILFPLMFGLMRLFPTSEQHLRVLGSEQAIDTVVLCGLVVYLYFGLRRAYQSSRLRSAISAAVLSTTVVLTIVAYQVVLFYLTFWTT
jgi:hypothetical protein